ncbi:hypothetical protein HDU76_000891 [Blyttiomyces sp. JEL0837]|nr:hypothetical protein HDU76_000891 [Blyttiomyces sp. JEL0837]
MGKATGKGKKRKTEEDEEDEEDVFVVEKILAHRKDPDCIRYKVRWKGYGEEDDTWEPAANFIVSTLDLEADKRGVQVLWDLSKSLGPSDNTVLQKYIQKTKEKNGGTPGSSSKQRASVEASPKKRKTEENEAKVEEGTYPSHYTPNRISKYLQEAEEPVKKKKAKEPPLKDFQLPAELLEMEFWDDKLVNIKTIEAGGAPADDVGKYRVVLKWKEGVISDTKVESEHSLEQVRLKCKDTLLDFLLEHIKFKG